MYLPSFSLSNSYKWIQEHRFFKSYKHYKHTRWVYPYNLLRYRIPQYMCYGWLIQFKLFFRIFARTEMSSHFVNSGLVYLLDSIEEFFGFPKFWISDLNVLASLHAVFGALFKLLAPGGHGPLPASTPLRHKHAWKLKRLFFNESFAFNTHYEHFYNLKLLYSSYLVKYFDIEDPFLLPMSFKQCKLIPWCVEE